MKEGITLSESDGVRYLHFGTPWVQGAMRIARPFDLELDYVRDMMAWLLFMHAPKQILQLGLGAGALTKWCWKHLPETQVTVVEREAAVVAACRQYFKLPDNDERLTVVMDDARRALRNPQWRGRFGVIQIDLYDAQAQGPVLDTLQFYRAAAAALAEPGVMVVNLFGAGHASSARSIERLHEVFKGKVLMLPQTEAGNRVVLCFKGGPMSGPYELLERRALWVDRKFHLGAARWLRSAWPLPVALV